MNQSTIKIYCGCCGKTIGTLKEDITFPFEAKELFPLIKNRTLSHAPLTGFNHSVCGHTMFSFKKSLGFMTLENYQKQVNTQN